MGAQNLDGLKSKEYTKSRFTLFAASFSVNEDNCTIEQKREILGSLNDLEYGSHRRGAGQGGGVIGDVLDGGGRGDGASKFSVSAVRGRGEATQHNIEH